MTQNKAEDRVITGNIRAAQVGQNSGDSGKTREE